MQLAQRYVAHWSEMREKNVGLLLWGGVGTHEAIISAEQFELVQRILETETRRLNDAETVALFAGFLYCGDCGSRLVRRGMLT